MQKLISLKIKPDLFTELEKLRQKSHLPRNTYINSAIDLYNQLQRKKILKEKLAKESKWVSKDSLEVLKEFENLMDEY